MKRLVIFILGLLALTACALQGVSSGTSIAGTSVQTNPTPSLYFPNLGEFQWVKRNLKFYQPLDIQSPQDGIDRVYIAEQNGRIHIIENGRILERPLLNISRKAFTAGPHQGLLGFAFHPDFKNNGYFFINYIDAHEDVVIARYHVPANALSADPESEKVILRIPQLSEYHHGGALIFGADGYLYIALGDSGGPRLKNSAQSTDSLLGKILRIDVDGGDPYKIPETNPFGNEVWAYGVRNPWRISFDRATQDLYIGDVGLETWEEINLIPAHSNGGLNFGWNIYEGAVENKTEKEKIFTDPIFQYEHKDGNCSITGGYVYRGKNLSALNGIYLYADLCTGAIWGLIKTPEDGWQARVLFETGLTISTFGEDANGELYFADYINGDIYYLDKK